MKIIFWGKGNRGSSCLQALIDFGFQIQLVVTHPELSLTACPVAEIARKNGLHLISPADPNQKEFEDYLQQLNADIFVLGGYGKILKSNILKLPQKACINLHGGKLPQFRGSSPLNWALIEGNDSFTLSILKVDSGIDTGNVLLERTFPITNEMTICDLHEIANLNFPLMLVEILKKITANDIKEIPQREELAGYYPLRFPNDGFIIWDLLTAEQVHNRVRALTEPYPCAFTYFGDQRVTLLSSQLNSESFYGEPGRIYRISATKGLLICASDKCLWIKCARITLTGSDLSTAVKRYDTLATMKGHIFNQLALGKASY